jgi:Flp pilus assembly protein TadD
MRTLTFLREFPRAFLRAAGGVLLLLLVGLPLGACSTFPGAMADQGAGIEPQTQAQIQVQAANPTPPLDEIKDDLGLGKYHFRAQNYGLAELHFRRAVEATPGRAEAWIGLAASYDQMKRWDLADRAYNEALKITGPTPELLNNRGYSYLLRGDIRRASQDLTTAAAKDPENERIHNNLKSLDARARKRV